MLLPYSVEAIIQTLEKAGFEACAVGGAVRDALRDCPADDWDVTTSARPEQVKACFAGLPVIETGIRHGTVTVLMDGVPVEITTYRTDGAYSDGRHPDAVRFTGSLQEDLARRDFTVNAMAWSPAHGLQDPFGGQDDLGRRLLRCVGEPHVRFSEDALRILRGVRFASVLGFEVEAATEAAIHEDCALLRQVSAERIAVEVRKLLCGAAADDVIRRYPDVLRVCIPALGEGFEDAMPQFAALPVRFPVRLAALLCGLDAEAASDACRALRLDTKTTQRVGDILLALRSVPVGSLYEMRCLYGRFGEVLGDVWALMEAEGGDAASQRTLYEGIRARGDCCTVRELAVTGVDMIHLGYRGEAVGRMLAELLDAVMRGEVENEKSALFAWIGR